MPRDGGVRYPDSTMVMIVVLIEVIAIKSRALQADGLACSIFDHPPRQGNFKCRLSDYRCIRFGRICLSPLEFPQR